jgi:hypothetical protein
MSDAEKLSPSQLQQTVKDGVLPEGIANLVNQTKPKASPQMPNQESTVADEVMGEVDKAMNPEDIIKQKIDTLKQEINQIHQGVQAGEVKPYIGIPLLKEKVQELSQLESMIQPPMQQAPMGQPPMGEMMQAPEQMPQGIDAAQSNLPTQMAQGGIASFAGGGETDEDYEDQAIDEDYDRAMSMIGNPAGEGMLPGAIMSRASKPSSKESSKPSSSSEIVTTGGVGVPTKLGKTTFDTAMNFVFPHEGGYGFHPADRGGHTKHGVIQNTLSAYLKRPASVEDVKNLTPEVARDIYKNMFWEPTRKQLAKYGMENDPQAQLVAFNAAMASGPGYSNPLIAKHKGDPYGMLREHTKFMVEDIPRRDPSQLVFQKGWGNRQRDLEALLKQVKPSYAEGGIAALASGGEVKHFAGEDGSKVEDRYPGATRDEKFYKGLASLPGNIARYLMPSRVIDDIGSIANWGQTPVQQQFKDKYPELYAKKQREKDAKEGMINKPYSLTPELKAQEEAYINAPNVFGRKDGETLNRQPFESNFPVNQPNVITPKINTGTVNPTAPAANVDKGEMGPPASLMGDAEPQENKGITSTGFSYNDLMNRMFGQEQNIKQQKEEDKYMSLLAAGLGMMGGTSQYAGANIGQGAMAGVQNYAQAARSRAAEQAALNKNMANLARFKEVGDIQRSNSQQQAYFNLARLDMEQQKFDKDSDQFKQIQTLKNRELDLLSQNRSDILGEKRETRQDLGVSRARDDFRQLQTDFKTSLENKYIKQNPNWNFDPKLKQKYAEEMDAFTRSPEYNKLRKEAGYSALPFEGFSAKEIKPK